MNFKSRSKHIFIIYVSLQFGTYFLTEVISCNRDIALQEPIYQPEFLRFVGSPWRGCTCTHAMHLALGDEVEDHLVLPVQPLSLGSRLLCWGGGYNAMGDSWWVV